MKMRLALFFALPVLLLFTSPPLALAQKVYRIGAMVADDPFMPAFEGFKHKMAAIGYVEGSNVLYDLNNAKGDRAALDRLAQKLVQDKPDLIVTSSTTATVPVAKASAGSNRPVVFLSAGNPLAFAKSYASSRNNLTGISTSTLDLTAKRLELLKELAPGIKRVISLHNPNGPNYEENLNATREAARRLGLELVEVNVTSPDELVMKSKEFLTRKRGDGIVYPPDAQVNAAQRLIYPRVNRARLVSVAPNVGNVHEGALATYAADYYALGQQGAILVDKILKGTRPTDLPIEQPDKLKLVINLKTAKAINLKIPKEILIRADEVVE
ncbi:MAG: ABC transporter substrate-binding protein [Deltaproteobacteria bacterium]|nr:ABC transporter substrate-binding protein [Deltaproteobacteria bacterium]